MMRAARDRGLVGFGWVGGGVLWGGGQEEEEAEEGESGTPILACRCVWVATLLSRSGARGRWYLMRRACVTGVMQQDRVDQHGCEAAAADSSRTAAVRSVAAAVLHC